MGRANARSNSDPSQYHSNGRLKSSEVTQRFRKEKSSAGDVVSRLPLRVGHGAPTPLCQISFSGCEDGQTSADVVKNGLAVGAMSYAFMKCLGAFMASLHFLGTGELSLWQMRTRNNLISSC